MQALSIKQMRSIQKNICWQGYLKSPGFLNKKIHNHQVLKFVGLTHILVNIRRWIQPRPLGMRCIFMTEMYIGHKDVKTRADSSKYLCVTRIGCVIW